MKSENMGLAVYDKHIPIKDIVVAHGLQLSDFSVEVLNGNLLRLGCLGETGMRKEHGRKNKNILTLRRNPDFPNP